jgi:hypothetical protein
MDIQSRTGRVHRQTTKRFAVLPLAVPAALAALSILVLSLSACGRAPAAEPAAGEIQYTEGDVQLNGLPALTGAAVFDGEVLTTGAGSFAEIKFGDYRVFRAQESTVLAIKAAENTFKLDRGALGVVQSRAQWFSRKKSWLVQTPTMVAAVRGTVYYVRVENPDSVYFCLCNGRIHLEDSMAGEVVELDAAHHRAMRFSRSGDHIVNRSAPMFYHTDRDMESLAGTVDVPIDWTVIPE